MKSAFFSAMPPHEITRSIGTPHSLSRSTMARAPKAVASMSAR
jgi:hypothetical protein